MGLFVTLTHYFLLLIALLFFISVFCLLIYIVSYICIRSKNRTLNQNLTEPITFSQMEQLPLVTIQLPLYNEPEVAERIIEATCALDYPKSRLQIQVLDDSTEDTRQIAEMACKKKQAEGINITYIHREVREGFKAGALQNGLKQASGELIAIFDSDFVPPYDFLHKTIPYFYDKEVGWVQTRWTYLNANQSYLTQIQAVLYEMIFGVEKTMSFNSRGYTFFSGSGGIIRRVAIDSVGGWSSDTLTEDGDLSCRALLNGWKSVYVPDIKCASELPCTIPDLVIQQSRWAKGKTQVLKKLLTKIIKGKIPFAEKCNFIWHYTWYLPISLYTFISLCILPVFLLNFYTQPLLWPGRLFTVCHIISVAGIVSFFPLLYRVALVKKVSFYYVVSRCWILTLITFGSNVYICKAILEGIIGHRSEFIRTQKYNITDETIKNNAISQEKISKYGLRAFAFGCYTLFSAVLCSIINIKSAVIFLPTLLFYTGSYYYLAYFCLSPEKYPNVGSLLKKTNY